MTQSRIIHYNFHYKSTDGAVALSDAPFGDSEMSAEDVNSYTSAYFVR